MTTLLLVLIVAGLVLALVSGIGVVTLIKLGVITRYAVKEETPNEADYALDESHEVD